jgi:hypothetical protein
MVDQNNPFSYNIRQAFLDSIVKLQDHSIVVCDEESDGDNQSEIENQPPTEIINNKQKE